MPVFLQFSGFHNFYYNFIEDSLYVVSYFSVAAFKILPLPFESLIIMYFSLDLSCNSLSFLGVYIFHQIWEALSAPFSLLLYLGFSQHIC